MTVAGLFHPGPHDLESDIFQCDLFQLFPAGPVHFFIQLIEEAAHPAADKAVIIFGPAPPLRIHERNIQTVCNLEQRRLFHARCRTVASDMAFLRTDQAMLLQLSHDFPDAGRIGADVLCQFITGNETPHMGQIDHGMDRHNKITFHDARTFLVL